MGYRSRRQPTEAVGAMQSLMAVRASEAYQNGDLQAIITAAQMEFAGEVALQNMMGSHRISRDARHQLYTMAIASVVEQ